MAKKANTFLPFVRELFDQYGPLTHLVHFTRIVVNNSLAETKDRIEKHRTIGKGEGGVAFGATTLFSLPVLHRQHCFAAHGKLKSTDEGATDLMKELEGRIHGQWLTMAFEGIERFLAAMGGTFYWQQRQLGKARLKLPDAVKKGLNEQKNTPPWFDEGVKRMCSRNCHDLLDQLLRDLPEFKRLCGSNFLNLDLVDVYGVIEFCRHKVVHAGGAMASFPSKFHRDFLGPAVKESVVTKEPTFLPSFDFVDHSIEHLAAMAFALFVEMSKMCGMQVTIPKPQHNALPDR